MTAAISIERLTKRYPGGRGVHDLDFEVETGEVFGFIGPNGSGKSTAIRTMLGLLAPTAGRVRVLGLDAQTDGPAARARVGYLPGEPRLYDDMRVGDMLEYLGGFHAGDSRPRRLALADTLELDLGRRCNDLSLGNKKKVTLVGALQHAPDLLILDEPTSGLDPVIQSRFFDVLRAERARGATVFFSSHVLSEVERLCDRVAILRDGRMIVLARVAELRARQVKRVRALVPGAAPRSLALAGVSSAIREGDHLEFLYRGEVRALLAALADDAVQDVTIAEPSLEEVVLAHYRGGDA